MRYDLRIGGACEVGLAAAGVNMGVAAHEGVEGASLVPASEELFRGVTEEAADVGAREGEAGDVLVEDHGDRSGEVRPDGLVVAGPHCADALRAREEGAGEDKGAFVGAVTEDHGFVAGVVEGEAVEVVNVAVFPISVVEVVFWHCCFWAVEHGGLVHIVPEKRIGSCAGEEFVCEE